MVVIKIYKNEKINVEVFFVYTVKEKVNDDSNNDKSKNFYFFNNIDESLKNKLIEKFLFYNYDCKNLETLFLDIDNKKYLLVGLKEDYNLEDLRRSVNVAFKYLEKRKEENILFYSPKDDEEEIISIFESLDLSSYKFDKFLSEKKKDIHYICNVFIKSNLDEGILKERRVITKYVKYVRNLVNENSYCTNPDFFENICKDISEKYNLDLEVIKGKELEEKGLNLIYNVGRGSQYEPRLIILKNNYNNDEKVGLVGKGVTFDTGGINLKPSGFLEDMKIDMGGAATMLGVFLSSLELDIKKDITLAIPLVENAIDGKSYKPGDVFKSYSGKYVEVKNTDAEGRLILADTLSYIQKNYNVNKIIDAATLTGACLIALGENLIAMLGNDEEMKNKIFKVGEKNFERVWELPIYDDHRDLLKSEIADFSNLGGKFGGTITAAAFLEKFIEENVKWVHLDIAGAAYSQKEIFYISKFGTGRGVRLLTEYLIKY